MYIYICIYTYTYAYVCSYTYIYIEDTTSYIGSTGPQSWQYSRGHCSLHQGTRIRVMTDCLPETALKIQLAPKSWSMGLGRFMLVFLRLKALELGDSHIPTFWACTVPKLTPIHCLRVMFPQAADLKHLSRTANPPISPLSNHQCIAFEQVTLFMYKDQTRAKKA